MIKLGLLGRDISHSRSQEVYEEILGETIEYTLFDFQSEKEIPDLGDLFHGLNGLSITAPYKNFFIGNENCTLKFDSYPAVNCVHRPSMKSDYELYNTDYLAVLDIIKGFEREFGKKIEFIILGDGNMARITSIALNELGHDYKVYSRSKIKTDLNSLDYSQLFKKENSQSILINCCSRKFIFKANIPSDLVFWDQNYALQPHQKSLPGTCDYRDGLGLLKIQAKEALKIWGLVQE